MPPSKRGDRAFWTTAEVRKLISVFARKEIQKQLDGTTRNRIAFEKMSSVLRSVGFNRTPAQCREKIKSMKKDYRKGKTSQFSAIIGKLMESYPVALRHADVDDDCTGEELEVTIINKLQMMEDDDCDDEEGVNGSDDEIWNEESDRGWMSSDDPDDPTNDTKHKITQRKRGAERMSHWSPVETLELLKIIGERDIQAALRKMVHTRLVWESISAKMSTNRSAEHCHDRWIYLKRRYRETVLKKQTDKWARGCYYYSELAKILAKQNPDNDQPTVQSTRASAASSGNVAGLSFYSRTNVRSDWPASSTPRLPGIPGSDDENDFGEDGDNQEMEDDDIDDLFGSNRVQDTEVDLEGEMSEDNGNQQSAHLTDSTPTTSESKPSNKREAGPSQRHPKRPRVRARPQAPPKEDLSIAEAITDAMMRFIDHQQFHLSQQTEILERYLKFERARMRWEMDMETRRMKWEEERDLREEERRQRQEENEEKRVSDNRQFMLQLAVVLGNTAATDDRERTKGGDAAVANSSAK